MALDALMWDEWLLRGGVGSVGFLGLLFLARWRWGKRDQEHGEADIGLD